MSAAASHREFPPPDTTSPQLTVRAVLTGMVIGIALTPSNVYSGLKIGWSFNMSIAAALLAYGFWSGVRRVTGARPFGLLENTVNQTAASSSASIVSAGLVAPIPALTLLTGRELELVVLAAWVLAVSLLGVAVAMTVRTQLLLRDRLSFPAGVATAETVREIYARGAEAAARVKVLLGTGLASGLAKLATERLVGAARLAPGLAFPASGALKGKGVAAVTPMNLGFALDPSLLMVGFGAIIGIRVGISLLLGALLAWGLLAPMALTRGLAEPGPATPATVWFAPLVEWLLWPGVTLMVVASLSSFAIALGGRRRHRRENTNGRGIPAGPFAPWYRAALVVTLVVATVAQIAIFGISTVTALLAVGASYVLAVVAGRVSGETGITPIGAMGKVTQLGFGGLTPDVTTNLMAANVTGGAAGQCADMLHDLKAGLLLGARPERQAVAQVFGVVAGSLAGSATYLVLVPEPASMLLTPEWPAPAVATWKAVAEVFAAGPEALPPGSLAAMGVAAVAGLAVAASETLVPHRLTALVPSAPAMGLAFVIPAWNSISMFLGALAAFALSRAVPAFSGRFLLAGAAGLVAGESLAGIGVALADMAGE